MSGNFLPQYIDETAPDSGGGLRAPTGMPPMPATPDLRNIWRVIARHTWLILATVVLLTGAAGVLVTVLSPRYSAEAVLMVGDQQPRMLDLQAVVIRTDTELIESEVQILRSRRIAHMVIDKLQLLSDPA